MAFVQRAHCGHESNRSILFTAQFARDGTHALAAADDFHSW